MNIVTVGHVDHGKSTIIGRLLADTGSLPEGKLDQIREYCKINSKPFEYAFLLDALKDERSQGITIDSSRIFFKSSKREYTIIDAPGHIEFLKNMLSGASQASAALLVIDAHEGIQENSRRHANLLSLIGVKQIAVLVNKMDLVDYRQEAFDSIVSNFSEFLEKLGVSPEYYIPVSGFAGENISTPSDKMRWFDGPTVLNTLDSLHEEKAPTNKPFRMPVQDVYKFTLGGDSRRIIAGTVETGGLSVGDKVVFYPSGKTSRVKSIEGFNEPSAQSALAGKAMGFTLEEQIYVTRGELATVLGQPKPEVSTKLMVRLLWLDKEPMLFNKRYTLKCGTAKAQIKLVELRNAFDTSKLTTLDGERQVSRHQMAECVFSSNKPIAFDTIEGLEQISRFVLVDKYNVVGGGVILSSEEKEEKQARDNVLLRNVKWEKSLISQEKRAERYGQTPTIVLITGHKSAVKKTIAKRLEKQLFLEGRLTYFLGIGNIRYGIDADIRSEEGKGKEHIRRLSEVGHIMLDAGYILILTATDITLEDLNLIKIGVDYANIELIWVGDGMPGNLRPDIALSDDEYKIDESVQIIKTRLLDKGIIFSPWK